MKLKTACLTVLLVLLAGVVQAASLDAIVENCNGCHGDDGVSQWTDVPTIAGIDAFVHSEALYIYREDGRPCGESKYRQGDTARPATTMCAIASKLDDETIEALAAYYSKFPFVAAKQSFDPELAAAGKIVHNRDCARCHSDGGSNPDDEASILAGQWMDYLRITFTQYAAGEREQPDKMKEKIDSLGQADVEALLHYYASQQ